MYAQEVAEMKAKLNILENIIRSSGGDPNSLDWKNENFIFFEHLRNNTIEKD